MSQTITIIGAGMGGLTLASILHRHGIATTVYDTDLSATSRHQGGMLDIHHDTGQVALQAAGLLERFRDLTLANGDALLVRDKTGAALLAHDGDGLRPEIDRGALRNLLLSSLPEGMVQWNRKVTGVAKTAAGWQVSFADGQRVTSDVLIGADGAWSKVRPLVSSARPVYAGVSMVELRYLDADRCFPVAAAIVGDGMLFALSDGKGLLGHREPNSELCVYVALRVPESWSDQSLTRAMLHDHFADWHSDYHTLLADSDGELQPRPIHALPVGHSWDRVPGVTLIGDAAHPMSPFAGEGVNLAMIDGADLAQAIIANPGDIEAALAAFEPVMFARAAEKAAESAANIDVIFAPDAPTGLLAFFAGHQG